MVSVPHTEHREKLDLVRAPSSLTGLVDLLESHVFDKINPES